MTRRELLARGLRAAAWLFIGLRLKDRPRPRPAFPGRLEPIPPVLGPGPWMG